MGFMTKQQTFILTQPLLQAWLSNAADYLPEGAAVPTLETLTGKMLDNGWDHFTLRDMMDSLTDGEFRKSASIFEEADYFPKISAVIMALVAVKSPGDPDGIFEAMQYAQKLLEHFRNPANRARPRLDMRAPQ